MEKGNQIYNVIRNIIFKNPSKDDYLQLDYQITKMVRDWLKRKADFNEEIIFDLKQDVLTTLLESFFRNSFWKEKQEENDDNNNAIKSYIYKIINSCYRKLNKEIIVNNDIINLKNLIQKSLKKLIEEKVITNNTFNNSEYYTYNNNVNKKLYDGYIEIRKLYVMRQESNNSTGRLSGIVVQEAVYEILKNLENYWLSLSDILKILLENSDVNNFSIVYIDNYEGNNDNTNTLSEEHLGDIDSDFLNNIDVGEIVNIYNQRIDSHLRSKRKADLYKICFYLYYKAGFTLREICEFIMMNYHIELSLQTIKNYLSDMIIILDLRAYSESLEYLYLCIEKFMNYIENEYKLYEI